jgi:hypothetical protein
LFIRYVTVCLCCCECGRHNVVAYRLICIPMCFKKAETMYKYKCKLKCKFSRSFEWLLFGFLYVESNGLKMEVHSKTSSPVNSSIHFPVHNV